MAEENNTPADHGKTLASWEFPEFKKPERTASWYVLAFIVTIALLAFAFFTQSYLFGVVIILFGAVYYMRSRRNPTLLRIVVTEDGIEIDGKNFYKWQDIDKFWIVYEPPAVKNLYLDFKAGLRPSITVFLENQNPLNIRKILLQYISEDTERENETFSDGFSRMLKL